MDSLVHVPRLSSGATTWLTWGHPYPMTDPWDWYIYLLIFHKNQANVWIVWVFVSLFDFASRIKTRLNRVYPRWSMYYTYLHIPQNHLNVGKYTIHGSYGYNIDFIQWIPFAILKVLNDLPIVLFNVLDLLGESDTARPLELLRNLKNGRFTNNWKLRNMVSQNIQNVPIKPTIYTSPITTCNYLYINSWTNEHINLCIQ